MAILLRLPKDLGEGVLCTSAIQKLKLYAENKGENFLAEGSKMMHAWVQTFTDEKLDRIELSDIQPEDLSAVVDFNIHDERQFEGLDVPYYDLQNIEHVKQPTAAFEDGAIVAPDHIVHMMEDVLKEMGVLSNEDTLEVSALPQRLARPELKQTVREKLGISDDAKIGLLMPACAANRPKKRIEANKFSELSERMEEAGYTPVLVAGPSDEEKGLCESIKYGSKANVIDASGQTSIDEICSLTFTSDLAIGVDIGPTHLCAASGLETFALFGKGSDPNTWKPLSQTEASHSIWVENLAELTAEEIWQSVQAVQKFNNRNPEMSLDL